MEISRIKSVTYNDMMKSNANTNIFPFTLLQKIELPATIHYFVFS